MFSRERLAKAAAEVADHLEVIEHIKALQDGQKELADAIKYLGASLGEIKTELRAIKADVTLASLKETQALVNSVQGGLNQRIETLAVKVAILEREVSGIDYASNPTSQARLPKIVAERFDDNQSS